MSFLGALKIKTITIGGCILLALTATGGAVATMVGVSMIEDEIAVIDKRAIPHLTQIALISRAGMDARLSMAKHILTDNPARITAADEALSERIAALDQLFADLRVGNDDRQQLSLLDKNVQAWEAWKAEALSVRRLSSRMDKKAASDRMDARLNPRGEALQTAIKSLRDHTIAQGKKSSESALASAESTWDLALAILIIASFVGLCVVILIILRVARPIAVMTGAMLDMARGNLDREVPFAAQTDEMGDIARALDAIKIGIERRTKEEEAARAEVQRKMIDGLAAALDALSNGRLSHRITSAFPAEYEVLRLEFNRTLESLADLIAQVAQGASTVRVGAGEISSAAFDLSERTENQAASLEESAAAVRQIAEALGEIAKSAASANSAAATANSDAKASGDMMTRAVAAMEEIAKSSSKMNEIIHLIDGIAFQTNLLALNAGVEAARAGDAGKGFAVVASEVRALAQRSAEAANDVKSVIKLSEQEVTAGVGLISEAQSGLSKIATQTSHLSELITTISESTSQQSGAIGQVNVVVSDLDKTTQQNAALVEESTAAARNLSGAAESLSQLVERFDVSDNVHKAQGAGASRRFAA